MAKKASKKKRKVPERFGTTKPAAEAAPNPFELLHSRKKFDVLGQKKKGVAKKTTKSRNEAMIKVGPPPPGFHDVAARLLLAGVLCRLYS